MTKGETRRHFLARGVAMSAFGVLGLQDPPIPAALRALVEPDPNSRIGGRRTYTGVRNAVREAANQYRADFIKVHNGLSPELCLAILAEARALKIPVAGHVPQLQQPIARRGSPFLALAEASNADWRQSNTWTPCGFTSENVARLPTLSSTIWHPIARGWPTYSLSFGEMKRGSVQRLLIRNALERFPRTTRG